MCDPVFLGLATSTVAVSAIGRMDLCWQLRSEARTNIQQPQSAYLHKSYYDCLIYTEPALRTLIDAVGVERVFWAPPGLATWGLIGQCPGC